MKLALVTGGMRRVGAAIAARLAQEGWSLALHCGHGGTPDVELAAMLETQRTHWHGFVADLADEAARAGLLPAIQAHFGTLPTLLVNNAALFEADDATTVRAESLAHHAAVNVHAPVLLACELAHHADAPACVINILDQRIAQPHRDQLSYTLSKQALAEATRTLARVLAPHIRVNGVAPGMTLATPEYSAAQMCKVTGLMPLETLPNPRAIADAVAYLSTAEHVTGQILMVDSGAHMRSFERDFLYL